MRDTSKFYSIEVTVQELAGGGGGGGEVTYSLPLGQGVGKKRLGRARVKPSYVVLHMAVKEFFETHL